MKITTVRYGFTFNRSNYQSERIDLEAALDPGETAQIVHYELKSRVHALGGDLRMAQIANETAERLRAGGMTIADAPLQYPDPTTF